jgi:hypothetical protein
MAAYANLRKQAVILGVIANATARRRKIRLKGARARLHATGNNPDGD